MNTTTLGRDPFMPHPPHGRGPALALALLAHLLLIAALAFGVHWRSSQPATMAAELWSAVPQAATPRAAETPAEVAKPQPAARRAEPVVPATPRSSSLPDPQIAIEQAKRDEAKRVQSAKDQQKKAQRAEAEREEAEREKQRVKEALAQKKLAADKLKVERERVEKVERENADKAEKADAATLAAAREANLKRMLGQAGATGAPADAGTAARSSGPSASYAGRIMARIKPNIVFSEAVGGNPLATVEVKLAPDGTIVAKRLVKSSGVKSWDDAVLRAIERTEVLPRDVDGRVPPPFQIDFRLRD